MAPKRATRSTPVTTTPAPTATTTTTVTNAQLQAMIDQGVSAALAARDATRNGTDSHSSGTGVRGSERVARECTYQDFMKCKPLYFKGTEGVVELTQWFERMETVFRISNCSVEKMFTVALATRDSTGLAIGSHTSGYGVFVYRAMTWVDLRRRMTDNIVPKKRNEKLEVNCYDLKVIGVRQIKRKECPKLKNNKGNRGNQDGRDTAPAKVYAVGCAGTNLDSNVVMDIMPSTLDHYYDVELADERIIGLNTILRGCTLNLLNHPFNINLMLIELGSFDAIIGMDWLAKYQDNTIVVLSSEKIFRIHWEMKPLIVIGEKQTRGHKTRSAL
ncbi:hypothetical protein Tco_1317296 [Tanacetum coccineum]